jgi:hypothetical protein
MLLHVVTRGQAEGFQVRGRFDYESNIEGGKWIIDVEPSSIVATTKVQPSEPKEPEEGEHLFHS